MIKDLLRIYKKNSEDSLIGTFNITIICEIYTQRLLKCTLKFQALVARLGEEREFANLSLITFCNMFRKVMVTFSVEMLSYKISIAF
jgi:hypothetical protein